MLWQFWPKSDIHLKKVSFSDLPGWDQANARKSLLAFQASCKVFLKQDPEAAVGSLYLELKAKDWYPACEAALSIAPDSAEQAKVFFESWFVPTAFYQLRRIEGLFTGYYMPLFNGSLIKTEKFNVPLYGLPKDLITVNLRLFLREPIHQRQLTGRLDHHKLIPYYTRSEINKGAIEKVAPVLAWLESQVDHQFLEIQGSGSLKLADGTKLSLGYAGANGRPYTSIARVLIDQGVMTKENASMQRIYKYFKTHPELVEAVLNQNESFVFFERLTREAAIGSQNVALTPGYSLAVDRDWVPLGSPVWLSASRPDQKTKSQVPFNRLMIAQDTGGAIRGSVRGDVYWGSGERATYIAGKMKNRGYSWLLLPKHVVQRIGL